MSEFNNNTTLRQAINTVTICGLLKKMEFKKDSGANGEYISGHLVIETAPFNEIRVDAFANRFTKASKDRPSEESSIYKGLVSVSEEYVSMASLMERGATEEEARANCTKVSANRASITLNEYTDRSGNTVATTRASANYFSRVKGEFEPSARFDVEGFIMEMRPEVKKIGDSFEETGRLTITLAVPVYGGKALPISFVTAPDVTDYIADNYHTNNTVRVYGNMVNSVNTVSVRKPGIKEEYETHTTYVNELLIDNGIPEPYGEDSPYRYSRDAIQNALNQRILALEERKRNREENKRTEAPGFASGNAPRTGSPFSWGKN